MIPAGGHIDRRVLQIPVEAMRLRLGGVSIDVGGAKRGPASRMNKRHFKKGSNRSITSPIVRGGPEIRRKSARIRRSTDQSAGFSSATF